MKKKIATIIWNLSEYFQIGLGKYAPKIFETMIGFKGTLIKKNYDTKKQSKRISK